MPCIRSDSLTAKQITYPGIFDYNINMNNTDKTNMNPWNDISLDDYENHMSLSSVHQLQALNRIMKDQLNNK